MTICQSVLASKFCEKRLSLVPPIEKMIARRIPPIRVQREETGLPFANRVKNPLVKNGKVHLKGDFGLSVWDQKELADWYALIPFLENKELARNELLEIARAPNYCPPGILTRYCEEIRFSFGTYVAILSASNPSFENFFSQSDYSVRLNKDVRDAHKAKGSLCFSWKIPGDIDPLDAQEIFMALAKETHIRHLQFKGLDGLPFKGSDLPIDTRIAMAFNPMIIPLAPFFHIVPIDLPDDFVMGQPLFGSFFPLLTVEIPVSSKKDIWGSLIVSLDSDSNPLSSIEVKIWSDVLNQDSDSDEARAEKVIKEIAEKLNDLAGQFRINMGLKSSFHVTAKWDEFGFIILKVKGISRLKEMLFYYFAAEKLNADLANK